jgi:hypothetical protein
MGRCGGSRGVSRYEQLKLAGKTLVGGRDLNSLELAGVGAFAGGFTGFVTTPLDVIKTRLMTQVHTLFHVSVQGLARCERSLSLCLLMFPHLDTDPKPAQPDSFSHHPSFHRRRLHA